MVNNTEYKYADDVVGEAWDWDLGGTRGFTNKSEYTGPSPLHMIEFES